jgi:hypothetical protein
MITVQIICIKTIGAPFCCQVSNARPGRTPSILKYNKLGQKGGRRNRIRRVPPASVFAADTDPRRGLRARARCSGVSRLTAPAARVFLCSQQARGRRVRPPGTVPIGASGICCLTSKNCAARFWRQGTATSAAAGRKSPRGATVGQRHPMGQPGMSTSICLGIWSGTAPLTTPTPIKAVRMPVPVMTTRAINRPAAGKTHIPSSIPCARAAARCWALCP